MVPVQGLDVGGGRSGAGGPVDLGQHFAEALILEVQLVQDAALALHAVQALDLAQPGGGHRFGLGQHIVRLRPPRCDVGDEQEGQRDGRCQRPAEKGGVAQPSGLGGRGNERYRHGPTVDRRCRAEPLAGVFRARVDGGEPRGPGRPPGLQPAHPIDHIRESGGRAEARFQDRLARLIPGRSGAGVDDPHEDLLALVGFLAVVVVQGRRLSHEIWPGRP